MKKLLTMLLAVALCLSLCSIAFAEGDTTLIAPAPTAEAPQTILMYVSIADEGKLVLDRKLLDVSDLDGDGALTICDALTAAHAEFYEGTGDGFVTAEGSYGPMITRLWGKDNGGSCMYYLNDGMAMGLTDPVAEGDYLYAFNMQDLTGWSDIYAHFGAPVIAISGGKTSAPLTLTHFDWNAGGEVPVSGAPIYVDGEFAGVITDEAGNVALPLQNFPMGSYEISAAAPEGVIMAPVVCTVKVGFDDVPASAWYYEAVDYAQSCGLMKGVKDKGFAPEANMTAAEFLTVIYRMGKVDGIFEDGYATEGENWQDGAKYVNEKAGLGFALDDDLTRAQMAVAGAYLMKQGGLTADAAEDFTDSADAPEAADIRYLRGVGIVDGYNDGSFRPEATMQRCEAAQVIHKMYLLLP